MSHGPHVGNPIALFTERIDDRRDAMKTRRILYPSDFSSASRPAFRRAVDMAKAEKAELLLVHVMSPVMPMLGDVYVAPKVYDDMERSMRAHGQKELDKLTAKAKTK